MNRCRPTFGQVEASKLASIGDVIDSKIVLAGAPVASGATKIFAAYSFGSGDEGLVFGIGFFLDSNAYATSPISLVSVGADAYVANSANVTGEPLDTYYAPVSRSGNDILFFPYPFGYRFDAGQTVGLQITNNEAVSLYCEGRLMIAYWNAAARKQAQANLEAQGFAPWGKVFSS